MKGAPKVRHMNAFDEPLKGCGDLNIDIRGAVVIYDSGQLFTIGNCRNAAD
jgi:hypothetical protein